jgi:hypothetical protein
MVPFCSDPRYVAQKPERPISFSAPRPLRNISCFAFSIEYARLDLETNAKAIAHGEPAKYWSQDKGLLTSYGVSDPRSVMWRSNPCKQFQLLVYVNERHITGIATKMDLLLWTTKDPINRSMNGCDSGT